MRYFFYVSLGIVLCLLATDSWGQTLRTVYVDPGVVGGNGDGTSWANAYSSLDAAEDAEDGIDPPESKGDIVTSNEVVVFECRSSNNIPDITKVTVEGWTTGPDNYILIRAHPDYRHNGIYGSASDAYKLEVADDYTLVIKEDYVKVVGLQLQNSSTSGTNRTLVTNNQTVNNNDILIDSCILNCVSSDSAESYIGITTFASDVNGTIVNTIVQNHPNYGMLLTAGTWDVYNCTVAHVSDARGIRGGGAVTVKNCAVFDTTDDFFGTFGAIAYCASDDGDGANPVAPSGGDWNNEFEDPGNGDYRLKTTGNLYQAGESHSNDSTVPTYDIIGTPRVNGSESIGAFEVLSLNNAPFFGTNF